MATTKFQNNVRTRLYKQNYQGFSQKDFLEAAKNIGCDDLENPTKEQIKAGVEYLIDKHNQSLAVSDDENAIESWFESESTQPTENSNQDLTDLESTQPASTNNSTAITNQQTEQLISMQAESLGVELNESEINNISQTVSDSFTDFVSAVETINSLIKEYAQIKLDDLEQRIENSNNNLKDYIEQRTNTLQHKTLDGAFRTKEVLEQKSSNLKSFSEKLSSLFKAG